MDLSQFDTRKRAIEGVKVQIEIEGTTVRGGDGKPVLFTVHGADSPLVREYLSNVKLGEQGDKSPEAVTERDIDFTAALVKGWTDNAVFGNEPFKYNAKNARALFAIPAIREALIAKALDRANFFDKA